MKNLNNKKIIRFGLIGTAIAVIGAGIIWLFVFIRGRRPKDKIIHKQLFPKGVTGLTDEEAQQRQDVLSENIIEAKPKQDRKAIIRKNVFSIFNYSMVGMALIQILLDKPLDALMTVGVIIFNIFVNVAQELLALKRIEKVLEENKPKATVIRNGKAKAIDANAIVEGDAVIIGSGDTIYIDGKITSKSEIEVDESILGDSRGIAVKKQGDPVFAGSICVDGRAMIKTQKVGSDRLISSMIQSKSDVSVKEELTPLEKILDGILKTLMVIVVLVLIFFGIKIYRLSLDIPTDMLLDAAGVIFSIAPTTLFFMVIVTYASGTSDLAKLGALITQSRDVEALASLDEICFAQDGILTGTRAIIEPNESKDIRKDFSKERLRHVLGDFAESCSIDNRIITAIKRDMDGNPRKAVDEMPYFSAYGWCSVTFDDEDLKGTYFLGEYDVLKAYLRDERIDEEEQIADVKTPVWKKFLGGNQKDLKKEKRPTQTVAEIGERNDKLELENNKTISHVRAENNHKAENENLQKEKKRGNIFSRFSGGIKKIIRRDGKKEVVVSEKIDEEGETTVYLFAYLDDILNIDFDNNRPIIPKDLKSVAQIKFVEKIQNETVSVLKNFAVNGVGFKIFAKGNTKILVRLLRQAGININNELGEKIITETDLMKLEPSEFAQAALDNAVFVDISPLNAALVVRALRDNGHSIAVVGDKFNDVPSMIQANLGIALQNSSQAARNQAAIILLKDSIRALEKVLYKGQQILKGLVDILKLNLTQIFYILMIIVAEALLSEGFPFRSIHLTVITIMTITIPTVGLTFLAKPGVVNSRNLFKDLMKFVIPVALTVSVAGIRVYQHFMTEQHFVTGLENREYAQLGVMYSIVFMGLILVMFVRPPKLNRKNLLDAWTLYLVLFLFGLFFVLVQIPLAQKYLEVSPLVSKQDYQYIFFTTGLWTIMMLLFYAAEKMSEKMIKKIKGVVLELY